MAGLLTHSPDGWTRTLVNALGLCAMVVLGCAQEPQRPHVVGPTPVDEVVSPASCMACHEEPYRAWRASQHAGAERVLTDQDRRAFAVEREVGHGKSMMRVGMTGEQPWFEGESATGEMGRFPVLRALGVTPMVQFVVEVDPGVLQVSQFAWDVEREEWFDVFGDEERRPGEWGHWTGRGMNWSSMCATCHDQGVHKAYRPQTQTWETQVVSHGVTCGSCHSGGDGHPAKGGFDKVAEGRVVDACGACHSRRTPLTETFVAGERFLDHFIPAVPGLSDEWWPDGQVRDENFEYMSFLGSRMYEKGVTCLDCHDPHTGALRRAGNDLCLDCHRESVAFTPHSHHPPGSAGDACVACHMPETVYLQRDARRDHGFTIPDPWLGVEHGVPDACTRCHTDRDPQWAMGWVETWFPGSDDGQRLRAHAVALARKGDAAAVPALVAMATAESSERWRATAIRCLEPWVGRDEVAQAVRSAVTDTSPLVRLSSIGSLVELGDRTAMRTLAEDPVRSVRVEAARWLPELPSGAPVVRELQHHLDLVRDQPLGAVARAQWLTLRGESGEALRELERAVSWDPGNAHIRHGLAVGLAGAGRPADALAQLEQAVHLAPDDGVIAHALGLSLHGLGRGAEAIVVFQRAVALDPGHVRAWHSLALAHHEFGDSASSLQAIVQGRVHHPDDVELAYVHAWLLDQMGHRERARIALGRLLEEFPKYAPGRALLDEWEGGSPR